MDSSSLTVSASMRQNDQIRHHSKPEEESTMTIIRVGVDIAKHVFQIHAVDKQEKAVWKVQLKRSEWIGQLCQRLPAGTVIGMEACASAHHWARELQQRGFVVKLIAAQYVKPYVKSNKNDKVDAAAICEAMSRPDMRFVPVKTIEQQAIQAIHRVRSELIKQRTAKANQIRGLVGEYGLIAATGIVRLRQQLAEWVSHDGPELPALFRPLLLGLQNDLRQLDKRVAELDQQISNHVAADSVAQRLMSIRGIGPVTASALSGQLADGSSFTKGREFAASLGLTPRQHSSGGKDRLLGISKRGDPYLRRLLVHGARAVIRYAQQREDALSQWIQRLLLKKHINIVTVALANKMARIAWAMVFHQDDWKPERAALASM